MIDNSILMEIYFLIDRLEGKLTILDPIKNLKNVDDIVMFKTLLLKCTASRKHLNKKYQNEKVMDEFDDLGEQLTNAFKQVYKN